MKQIALEPGFLPTKAPITKHRPGGQFKLLPSDLQFPQQRQREMDRLVELADRIGWSKRSVNTVRRLVVVGDPGFAGDLGRDVLIKALTHEKTTPDMATYILKALGKIDNPFVGESRLVRIIRNYSTSSALLSEAIQLVAKRAEDHTHTVETINFLTNAGTRAVKVLKASPKNESKRGESARTILDAVTDELIKLHGKGDKYVSDYADSGLDAIVNLKLALGIQ